MHADNFRQLSHGIAYVYLKPHGYTQWIGEVGNLPDVEPGQVKIVGPFSSRTDVIHAAERLAKKSHEDTDKK